MNVIFQFDTKDIDWAQAAHVVAKATDPDGGTEADPEAVAAAFNASQVVAFAFDGSHIVAVGRAEHQGEDAATIHDIYVLPPYQKQALGSIVMDQLIRRLPGRTLRVDAPEHLESWFALFGFQPGDGGMVRQA